MPWEIDYLLLQVIQFKKSLYHLNLKENKFTFELVLNLSDAIISWDESNISKKFFIEKYDYIMNLLNSNDITVIKKMYQGEEDYGCLNAQRECYDDFTDFYISVCPDIYFSENILFLYVEATKNIKNKYFLITPQINKRWDNTWDVLVNEYYKDNKYTSRSDARDAFDERYVLKYKIKQNKSLIKISNFKFAGWCDLYNKNFFKELVPNLNWSGYGPWDLYAMLISQICKNNNVDIQQYVLNNEIISDYSNMNIDEKNNIFSLTQYYKNNLKLYNPNLTKIQRETFENKIDKFISDWIEKNKGLLN